MRNRNKDIGILIAVGVGVVAVAAIWIGYGYLQSLVAPKLELPVESVVVFHDANYIEVSGGEYSRILSINDFPDDVQVSTEASFGSSDVIREVEISPSNEWLAISIGGAAHDFGWIYRISSEELLPVAFSYGGGVAVMGWQTDTKVVFEITTPEPATYEKVIDVTDPPVYPGI